MPLSLRNLSNWLLRWRGLIGLGTCLQMHFPQKLVRSNWLGHMIHGMCFVIQVLAPGAKCSAMMLTSSRFHFNPIVQPRPCTFTML